MSDREKPVLDCFAIVGCMSARQKRSAGESVQAETEPGKGRKSIILTDVHMCVCLHERRRQKKAESHGYCIRFQGNVQ